VKPQHHSDGARATTADGKRADERTLTARAVIAIRAVLEDDGTIRQIF
jgi:hypothetical protein